MSPNRALPAIAAVAAALLSSSCWYAKQASRFLSERARAVPVSRLEKDPGAGAELKDFLALVEDVRRFATDGAGLRPTGNYTAYVALDRDYVADVVSACAADSFERRLWRYPFVGSLPYKGFYDRKDAEAEARRLKDAGLDVIIRKVDAFSSLGFFRDPLYSFMVDYEPDTLAELVLHESAHATLFIKGDEQFNEEFATFVGRLAADLWVALRYGEDSPEAAARRARRADGQAFVSWLRDTAALLEAVYADPALGREEKLARKAALIAERAEAYREAAPALFTAPGYRQFDMGSINNAYLDLYRLYEEDLSLYRRWYDEMAGGSLPRFVESLVELAGSAGKDIKRVMAEGLSP